MFERFRRDLQRLFDLDATGGSLSAKARALFHYPQIQGLAVYRFGHWVNERVKPAPLRVPLKIAYHVADKTVAALWGVHIDDGADIGGGLYLGQHLVIGPVKMGEDCNVGSNTLIGRRSDGAGKGGVPTIGDRVWIGAGSIVFGGIVVGEGTSIAPLTVIGRNVPPNTLALGNPMQILRKNYDNSQQIYGKARASSDR